MERFAQLCRERPNYGENACLCHENASKCGKKIHGEVCTKKLIGEILRAIALNAEHSLYHLLQECKQTTHNLRPRAHPFVIPSSLSALHDKNYIVRIIRTNNILIAYYC